MDEIDIDEYDVEALAEELSNMTEDEFEQFINSMPPTEAGAMGFEVNNVPLYENAFEAPAGVADFNVINTTLEPETVREYEAFGVKLNDSDDIYTVGILFVVITIVYIGKCSIDFAFACLLDWYRGKRAKKDNNGE